MVHCIRCQKEIDPAWPFCPFCGADNRAPESRPPVPAHTHDFSKGFHCLICGESHSVEGRQVPAHGYVYNSYTFMVVLLFIGFALMFFGFFAPVHDLPLVYRIMLRIVGGVIFLLGLLFQERVMVDLDRREVRDVLGIWPIPRVNITPFSECKEVVADVRLITTRQGGQDVSFPVTITLLSGDSLGVKTFTHSEEAYSVGLGISHMIGIPFQNKASGAYW